MSNIDKRALREVADAANKSSWGRWESYHPHKGARRYEVKVGVKAIAQHCLKVDSAFIAAANPATVLALLDELEAVQTVSAARLVAIDTTHKMFQRERDRAEKAEKRIAELEAREINLPPYSFFDFKQGSPFKSGAYCHIDSVNKELSKHGIKMTAAAGKGE
ncbi:ead/Ea22-like family protein [Enterobacter roggenkampii]|uniref:ead/Ea22-like family protein n=1 Tax=Enterobacter roggenkampii TaxID=1812935 RepID=UPI00123C262B|nr:ead/Ea22-like family protein [Enterobacter roggenkampii]MCK6768133.1 ead/Ea22-like family protein [Enterobacter roggenkampii]HDS5358208.1 ead/Ea22-like family protein [Enterobacter roggenkampii]